MKEGIYFYYFIVDGKIRFAPDQPTCEDKAGNIVNYFEVEKCMIEMAMKEPKKVKNMADCLAKDLSWCLSAKFEQDCKEKLGNAYKSVAYNDGRIHLTSHDEDDQSVIFEVMHESSHNSESEEMKSRFTKMQRCMKFCPSSSYLNEGEDYLSKNTVEMNDSNMLYVKHD